MDESFVDFAGNGETLDELTMISEEVLARYGEGIYIIKSISKSYGVPGVRLGALASANEKMIRAIKQNLPIWNINSFGEFYMQIAEKYRKDYVAALSKMDIARKRFAKGLEQISWLRVIPSRANYIMCEITDRFMSKELACRLLEMGVFIKDLTSKIGNGRQYVRIAVRREEDNEDLVRCLKELQQS